MKSAVLDLCMNRDVAERQYEHIPDVELYLEITMVAGIVLILQGVCNKKIVVRPLMSGHPQPDNVILPIQCDVNHFNS